MLDVTQAMACIHCGVCVSACLSLEVDPEFIGPAALAKAYRFVGDPRDGADEERLKDLAEDPHGIYDCTHCFACVEVCPKDVAPMNQIMRLRRRATDDYEIKDHNNGYGHEKAFVTLIEKYGTLHEAQLLPRSFGDGSLVARPAQAERGQAADREPAHRDPRAQVGQGHAEEGAAPPQAAGPGPGAPDLQRGRVARRADRAQPLHRRRVRRRGAAEGLKLAYWPGCVSRGFTPELHGSVAKVAPLLDIELVELDRANCCGAGVIAEHNQELADTLNARTFAMAQGVEGAAGMMNICSTCQGAQSECQERLDADSAYRGTSQLPSRSPRASPTSATATGGTRTSSGSSSRRSGSTRSREQRRAPARGAAHRALLRLLHRAPDASGSASTSTRVATSTSSS